MPINTQQTRHKPVGNNIVEFTYFGHSIFFCFIIILLFFILRGITNLRPYFKPPKKIEKNNYKQKTKSEQCNLLLSGCFSSKCFHAKPSAGCTMRLGFSQIPSLCHLICSAPSATIYNLWSLRIIER
jgi:hypothetical protein